jgi:hypothetical protein
MKIWLIIGVLFAILLIFPSISFSSTIRGDTINFYPTSWEIRGIGNAIWEDKGLTIYADGIIVNLITGNVVAFGNVRVEKEGKKEYYDVFSTKELTLNIYESPVIPYITAKEIDIDWRMTTMTLKNVRLFPEVVLPSLSIPFGPYSSGIEFSSSDEIISFDTSSPYISISLPYNDGIFTEILNQTGIDISYEKEGYYLIGIRTHMDMKVDIFGEYTFYFENKSLGLTLGYDDFFYTVLKKEVRDGLWKYIGKGTINWGDSPEVLFSIEALQWDRLILKGELSIDTETGGVNFTPYIGYKTDITKDLTLDFGISNLGLDSINLVYKLQPSVNLRIGYLNPQNIVFGIDWGYRSLDIEYNSNLSIILK